VWAIVTWQALGAPSRFVLAELGPGRGTLMADLLRVARVKPDFLAAAAVNLVETSPRLRAIQEKTLAGVAASPRWHERLDTLPDAPLILIANEFFDALPIRQFLWTGSSWGERMVGIGADDSLVFGMRPVEQRPLAIPLPEGAVFEVSPAATAVMNTIAARLAKAGGAALAIDYGSDRIGYGDTLQAVRQHQYVDPLAAPGEADLTAHVDFTALAKAASAGGAEPRPIITQGAFLTRLGLV